MKKIWKATFRIKLKGSDLPSMTSQIARDKLLVPLQEMWILRHINSFTIEEIVPSTKVISKLSHEDTKGKRESFYKTGFPKKTRRKK